MRWGPTKYRRKQLNVACCAGFRTPTAERAAPSFKRPASETLSDFQRARANVRSPHHRGSQRHRDADGKVAGRPAR
jgi:hypothetical protein